MAQQKLERRERILAAARELIAELPYKEITVRELARRCRVSVPTLYNQFGGKDALLAAAVESQFREALSEMVPPEELPGAERILGMVSRVARQTTELAEYHASLIQAFAEEQHQTEAIQQSLAVELTRSFAQELEAMAAKRQLAEWVDCGVLAVQLTTACISASVIWGQGMVDDEGLDAFMRHGAATPILACARGPVRAELEAVVREAQDHLREALTIPEDAATEETA